MASHHYDYLRSRRHAALVRTTEERTQWASRMPRDRRTEPPLGLHIREGEITLYQGPHECEKAAGAAKSLTPTCSNSHCSPTDESDFQSLSAGIPVDEDPDRRKPAKGQCTATVRPGAYSLEPAGDLTGSATDTAMPHRGDEDQQDGTDQGTGAEQAQATRRSSRLRAAEGKQPEGRGEQHATSVFPRAMTAAPRGAAAGATSKSEEVRSNSNSSQGNRDGDGDEHVDMDSGNGTGVLQPVPRASAPDGRRNLSRCAASAKQSHPARAERLEYKLYKTMKDKNTAADISQHKPLVKTAEAQAITPRQAADPLAYMYFWARLSMDVRTKALNKANAVWSIALEIPGHAQFRLLGQLSKRSSKGTRRRFVWTHTDAPSAQAQHLLQLTSCRSERPHKHGVSKHIFGHVWRSIDALQTGAWLHEPASTRR